MKGQWIISAIINDAFHKEYVESSEQAYQELLSHVDNLDEFKKSAQQYKLEIDERILYEKIIDLEFLLYGITEEC